MLTDDWAALKQRVVMGFCGKQLDCRRNLLMRDNRFFLKRYMLHVHCEALMLHRTNCGSPFPVDQQAEKLILNPARKHALCNKYDDLVEEVDLVEANSIFASVQQKDGREQSASLNDLATCLDV